MPIAWPATLPENPSGYSEKAGRNTIRTPPDSGPAKSRRRFTKSVKTGRMEFFLTLDQMATMKTFYETTLKDGSLSMDFNHPWTGVLTEMYITEPPDFNSDGPLMVRATFPVEYY
jgi:hypothetical protein